MLICLHADKHKSFLQVGFNISGIIIDRHDQAN